MLRPVLEGSERLFSSGHRWGPSRRIGSLLVGVADRNWLACLAAWAPPRVAAQRRVWRQQALTVAAYRDRYGITDDISLGAPAESTEQKIDAARAKTAVDHVSGIMNTSDEPTTRRAPERDPLSL